MTLRTQHRCASQGSSPGASRAAWRSVSVHHQTPPITTSGAGKTKLKRGHQLSDHLIPYVPPGPAPPFQGLGNEIVAKTHYSVLPYALDAAADPVSTEPPVLVWPLLPLPPLPAARSSAPAPPSPPLPIPLDGTM